MTHPPPPHVRYQFKPYIGSSHHWAMDYLSSLTANSSVLDVGSGSGAMGAFLKERGVRAIYAVEPDSQARAHGEEIYVEIEPSLEPFKGRTFDIVLLLDVLEHMTDPLAFLKELLPLVRNDGVLLISVPNIAHWSVRIPLLFGILDYYDRGILDRTHRQFFTRKRFHILLQSAGLQLMNTGASIEPVELVLPSTLCNNPLFRSLSKVRKSVAQLLPGLMGYQHLVLAKKP